MQGTGYSKIATKYDVSKTTICKWVIIYQGIHNPAAQKKAPEILSFGHETVSMENIGWIDKKHCAELLQNVFS